MEHEWATGHKKTLLVLPTGTGKTIVFAKVAEDCVRQGKRTLVLAHRQELLDQAADKIETATGLKSAVEKAEDSCLGSWYRITVGSVQTLMRENRLKKFTKDYFGAIIVDEAHHAISTSYQNILRYFDTADVLGVTATPDRGDMKNLGTYFDSLAYEYSLPKAIKDGYLSPIKAQTIPLQLDITGVGMSAGDYKAGDLGNALDPYLEQIANEMANVCMNRKTVVFLPLVKTSQKFRDILNAHGFTASEVNGTSDDRAEILRDFDAGKYNVLCNSMLLTEGWDCPSVDCIVVLRPTKSRSLYCLDSQTEILTENGWKRDVDVNEAVAAFDPKTEDVRFVPAIAKIRRKLMPDEYFCSISGASTDIRVTNKHRMLYDNKRRAGWKIKEAEQIANMKDGCIIPVAGKHVFKGIPLTDADLTFIGWVMTDGSINKVNHAISITQAAHQKKYVAEIEKCIIECGFKFTRREFDRQSSFNSRSKCVLWTISRGAPRGRDKDKTGWGRLEPWLSKDLEPTLFDMTDRQFGVMLEAINHGDGRKNKWISYHISKGNKLFIERLQIMAIQRGYRASIAIEKANIVRQSDLYTLHIKKQNFVRVGSQYDGRPTWKKENHTDEYCWCVQNELGTLITRRNGKVSIVGNCQMVGRGTRLNPGKTELLLLDFLWLTEKHELCRPAHLIAKNKEVADKMTANLEEAGEAVDLEEAELDAEEDVVAEREQRLAEELAAMRNRKRKLVDPLQFEMSIQAEDLANYEPAFGWEMGPASDRQLEALEKYGIFPDSIENAGKANLILDRLAKRRMEGLTTPKQIRFLEGRNFQHIGSWTFEEASKMITRISFNNWRVPADISPESYVPESMMH